ncbi:MAG: PAS domain S-box protein [Desulfobacula sp.]|nr:PAS domain S-box protein [Desulfobacula sp.]
MKKNSKRKYFKSLGKESIGRRLVVAIIIFSSFITLLTTAYQLYFDYKNNIKMINENFLLIENSYLESLSTSVWMYDGRQIATQLDGLLKLPDIEHLKIKAGEGSVWTSGTKISMHTIIRVLPVTFLYMGQTHKIGTLEITAGLDNIYDRLIGRAISILSINAILVFCVAGFILFIFHIFVTRHLMELAEHVKNINLKRLPDEIKLKRKTRKNSPDEIDQVVLALNQTQGKLFEFYEALVNSEDELSRIFTMSMDMICISDLNTLTFIKVNPAFTKTLGFSNKELTSQSFLQFIHPQDRDKTLRIFKDQLKTGNNVVNFENRYICKDGTSRWLRWASNPIPEKGVTYAVGHDITDIKDFIGELEETHSRFLTVLDAIDAHIYVADMDTYQILFMNTKMKKDFNKDMTGQVCWAEFCGKTAPCDHCTNDKLTDTNGEPTGVCVWQGKNPITGKWYINYDRAIQWIDGKTVRLQIAMDITHQKVMEEKLRQSHKMEAVGTLAGGIAHDFNNILGIVLGNTELALDDIPDSNPARSNLNEIKIACLRARDVVRQLLSFSRESELQRISLDVVPVLVESIRLLRASIPTSIQIRSHINDNIGLIKADPTQIQQVIINLCTNAAHAMDDMGGLLDVFLSQVQIKENNTDINLGIIPGPYLQLRVQDTGKGIDSDILDKIFDPYFTTKDVGKGSGMGLSIVHGIIKNHDGFISIDTLYKKGAAINVLLPVCTERKNNNYG